MWARVPSVEPNKKRQAQRAICKLAVVIRPSHAGWRIVISPPATESEAEEVEVVVEVEGASVCAGACVSERPPPAFPEPQCLSVTLRLSVLLLHVV